MINLRRYPLHLLISVAALTGTAVSQAVTIQNVRSGTAILRQQQRLTILEVRPKRGPSRRIALTHPSDYRQGTNSPLSAQLIAESPNHFLIFTDTFASNPSDIQGKCGANETGERYIHVVALGNISYETLSVLIDSCLLDLQAASRSPEWIANRDSAGFMGKVVLSFEGSSPVSYYVAMDGTVTRAHPDTSHQTSR